MQTKKTNKISISRIKKRILEASPKQEKPKYSAFRIKTEGNHMFPTTCNRWSQINQRTDSSFQKSRSELQILLEQGHLTRKSCLKQIVPVYQTISFTKTQFLKKKTLKAQQKQNIRKQLRNSLNSSVQPRKSLNQRVQRNLAISFNKFLKDIKQRNILRQVQQKQELKDKVQAFGASIKGEKHNTNQDSVMFSEGIYVICDGHGANGKQIADFVCNTAHKFLQEVIRQHPKFQSQAHQLIKNVIKKVQMQLDLSGIDIAFSGCTFVALLLHQNQVFTISIGDSKAILCAGVAINALNVPHKPDHPLQKKRIQTCGGVIRPIQIGKDKFAGPNRIWAPGKSSWGPGLALSRAFGDTSARKYGVITQADISVHPLTYQDDFVVMGSDGLFDFMKDSDISFFIRKKLRQETGNKDSIAIELSQQARKRSGADSDDVSCIVILL